MFIRVPGDSFKLNLLELLQGSAKVCINFLLTGNTLCLQTSGLLIDEKRIPVSECDANGMCNITVELDKTLELINENETVSIEVKDTTLEIIQDSFRYICDAVYESRVDDDLFSVLKVEQFNKSEFSKFVYTVRGLDEVAKILAVGLAPVHVYNNVAYVYYSNTLLVDKLSLPNCSMSSESMRKLAPVIQRSDGCTYKMDNDKGLLYCNVSSQEAVAMPIKMCNPSLVKSIKDVIVKCEPLQEVNINKYTKEMTTICKAYTKIQLEMAVCDDGLRFTVDLNGKTSFNVGSKKSGIVRIQISVAQLAAVNKIFGDYMNVQVERGVNCICLKLPNSEKRLLISGMLY